MLAECGAVQDAPHNAQQEDWQVNLALAVSQKGAEVRVRGD